jgi:hypothetical protein
MAGSVTNFIKAGFGLSVGFSLAGMLFLFIGFLFFFPGYILFKKESVAKRNGSATQIFAVILMALGVILMGGAGFGILLSSVNEMS